MRLRLDTALRVLRGIELPPLVVPRMLGTEDFALRRGQVYTTVLIGSDTGRWVVTQTASRHGSRSIPEYETAALLRR